MRFLLVGTAYVMFALAMLVVWSAPITPAWAFVVGLGFGAAIALGVVWVCVLLNEAAE